jgi:hypothetical protein
LVNGERIIAKTLEGMSDKNTMEAQELDAEKADREDVVKLQKDVRVEVNRLDGRIDTEAATRQTEDGKLSTRIDTEAATRQTEDGKLDAKIADKQDRKPDGTNTLLDETPLVRDMYIPPGYVKSVEGRQAAGSTRNVDVVTYLTQAQFDAMPRPLRQGFYCVIDGDMESDLYPVIDGRIDIHNADTEAHPDIREGCADEISAAIADEVKARNEAIAAAQIGGQTWLPAVETKADLPDPSSLTSGVNYLCRVIKDPDPDNNGVWQFIVGATDWTYFSDNLDFIDEAELQTAINAEAEARDEAIDVAIAAEAETRETADETLQANIEAEAQARETADTAEAETRQSADEALQEITEAALDTALSRVSKAIFNDSNGALVSDMAIMPEEGALANIRKTLKNVSTGEVFDINVHVTSEDGTIESRFDQTDEHNYTLNLEATADIPPDGVTIDESEDGKLEVKDGGVTTDKMADGAVTSAKLADNMALTGTPTAPTAEVGTDTTQIATTAFVDEAVSAEAEARDTAIAQAKLSIQTWLAAVDTKADLADPATLDHSTSYLCRVMKDPTPADNGVWQLISGAAAWTYFSDNLDFVDETELQTAIAGEATARDEADVALKASIQTELSTLINKSYSSTPEDFYLEPGVSLTNSGSIYYFYCPYKKMLSVMFEHLKLDTSWVGGGNLYGGGNLFWFVAPVKNFIKVLSTASVLIGSRSYCYSAPLITYENLFASPSQLCVAMHDFASQSEVCYVSGSATIYAENLR